MPPLSEGEGATISAYECVCGTTRQRMKECSCEPPRAQRYRSAVQLLSQRGQRYCPKGQRKKRLLVTNVTEDQVRLARSKDIGNGNGQAPDYVTDRGLCFWAGLSKASGWGSLWATGSAQFACLGRVFQ
jgi:hypothetical protein